MMLYGFYPAGYGQYSFFTMAESLEEAFKKVNAYVMEKHFGNEYNDRFDYCAEGWGTDYYSVCIGDVLENPNY